MTVKKVGDKWFVVKKGGALGKRGYSKKSSAESAQARGRALAGGATSASRKPSSGSSGGGSTAAGSSSKAPGIGLTYRRFRTGLNITAPGWGVVLQPGTRNIEDKLSDAVERYSGFHPQRGTMDAGPPIESAKGIGVSLINDWADRKLRNSAKISRGKFFNILVEGLPWLRARIDAGATIHPFYVTACNFNKRTTGYSPQDGYFQLGRVEEYAVSKALVAGWDKLAPKSWKRAINSVFGKGINPA